MVENKKKYAYWMYPSMVKEIEKSLESANATSKSDFVCQAVKFYIRFLHLGKSMNLIAPLLEQTVHNEAESVERNLSEMMFKIAVELGVLSNVICAAHNYSDETVSSLRENVAEEVASTNGLFSFEDAYDWQRD